MVEIMKIVEIIVIIFYIILLVPIVLLAVEYIRDKFEDLNR